MGDFGWPSGDLSYADLAIKYNTDEHNVRVYYMRAKTLAYEFIEALRTERKVQANWKIAEIHKKKLNKLQANVKAFLFIPLF